MVVHFPPSLTPLSHMLLHILKQQIPKKPDNEL